LSVEVTVQTPACPDHGDLIVDLARGRLDTDDAHAAELAIASCRSCRAWWHGQIAGRAAAEIDHAVAAAFASFQPTRSRRGRPWLAAAALAVAAVAAGVIRHATRPEPLPPSPATAELVERLFDDPDAARDDLTGDGVVDASDLVASLRGPATLR
jgi:hypothetical protein